MGQLYLLQQGVGVTDVDAAIDDACVMLWTLSEWWYFFFVVCWRLWNPKTSKIPIGCRPGSACG